ncbi:MAG: hypothetical protein FJ271_31020 [Planctomycetes bacterium]|nr:hypothetical protein [Planctomycetota bacterium]
MNLLHPSAKFLVSAVAAVAVSASVWGLPPRGKDINIDPKVKPAAAGEETLKHGMRLRVTMKDKSHVQGTLVWADEAGGYWMIRSRPGALPRKIMEKDIAEYQRIRLVNDSGDPQPDEPEIHQVSVVNGNLRKVQFFAAALSTSERSRLSDLEIAENEMARAEQMMSLLMASLRDELQAIRQDLRFQDQRNMLMTQYLMYGMYPSAGYFNPIWGYGSLGGFAAYSGFGLVGVYGMGAAARDNIKSNAGKIFETLMTKEVTLSRQIAEARRTLNLAQSFARYDGDRLVAIMPDTTGTVRPAADTGK